MTDTDIAFQTLHMTCFEYVHFEAIGFYAV